MVVPNIPKLQMVIPKIYSNKKVLLVEDNTIYHLIIIIIILQFCKTANKNNAIALMKPWTP